MPTILADRSRPAEDAGAVVALFLTSKSVLVAAAKNPLSMCFAGEMALDCKEKSPEVLLSATPMRLRKRTGDARQHTVRMLAGEWEWVPYARDSGEFSVPTTRAQCDEVLDGAQRGQIPVFEAASGKGEGNVSDVPARANAQRAVGNERFKKGEFDAATRHYTAAIELLGKVPPSSVSAADRAAPIANRCAALLKLCRYSEAQQDAERVLKLVPEHEKAQFRLGQASSEL